MTEVYDAARRLGTMLQSTPQWEMLESAQKAFDAEPEIGQKIQEYNQLHQEFQMKMQQGGIAPEENQKFQEDMKVRAEEIQGNEIAKDFFTAQNTFGQFMDSVMQMINSTLTGEEPDQGCSPSDCSSCGGGCGCGH